MSSTSLLKNDLLLRAARGEKVERTPVWSMRQAGRILPEYRAVRAHFPSFVDFVKDSERAAEVSIQPVDLLGVDAAIIFSDILVVPEAMGLIYHMQESKGPIFPKTLSSVEDLKQLSNGPAEDSLEYVAEAIRICKRELNNRVPLIGFAGAPFTIFCYMTEGQGSKTFSKSRKLMYSDPAFSHQLLERITEVTIRYLKKQIEAGADIIQIFDSWAGVLPPDQYEIYSMHYIRRICEAITEVPVIVFAKGAYFARKSMGTLPCEVIGLDWNMPIAESRALIGENKTLQGNLDPCCLYGNFEDIRASTIKMLREFGPYRHIANLGHGVYPDTNPDNVRCFIDTVKNYQHS